MVSSKSGDTKRSVKQSQENNTFSESKNLHYCIILTRQINTVFKIGIHLKWYLGLILNLLEQHHLICLTVAIIVLLLVVYQLISNVILAVMSLSRKTTNYICISN